MVKNNCQIKKKMLSNKRKELNKTLEIVSATDFTNTI